MEECWLNIMFINESQPRATAPIQDFSCQLSLCSTFYHEVPNGE